MKFKLKNTKDVINVNLITLFKKIFFLPVYRDHIFFSTIYGIEFNKFSEYWIEIGRRNSLVEVIARQKTRGIHGISFEEVLQKASISEFGSGTGIIMYNINTYTLGRTLDRFEGIKAGVFNEDFVFIPMDSRDQARKFLSTVPESLAEAIAVDRGLMFAKNYFDIEEKRD